MNSKFDGKANLAEIIRREVEEEFGRSVTTYGDCNALCTEIYKKTGFTLNQNTLRRFFGLVKARYPASKSTLTILARYCSFNAPEEMVVLKERKNDMSLQEEDASILFYFLNLLKALHPKGESDDTFFTFMGNSIQFLQKKPELIEKFQRAVSKTPLGRKYYFEHFINIDKLNSFFGAGLRFYLNENKVPEGQVFGYSLLCMRDWLVNDPKGLKKNYDYLQRQNVLPGMPVPVYRWYYAARFFYADVYEPKVDNILTEAYNMHNTLKPGRGSTFLYDCFEYPLSFALVLTQHYEDALFYINYAFANYKHKEGHVSEGCYELLLLLKAIALAKTNEQKEARAIFEKLSPSDFYFTTKKFSTILYLLLALLLKEISQKQFKQSSELIEKTGFEKLTVLFERTNA